MLKVLAPSDAELAQMKAGAVLVGMLNPFDSETIAKMATRGITAFALEAAPRTSRHAPETAGEAPRFALVPRKAIEPDAAEVAATPRARSAKLRLARRLAAPAGPLDAAALGLPALAIGGAR